MTWIVVVNLFTAAVITMNAAFDIRRMKLSAKRELTMLRRVHELEMMIYKLENRLIQVEKSD